MQLIHRRTLFASGAALAVGMICPPARGQSRPASHPITAWVRVGEDDSVTVILSQCEIGQGISTTLPAIVADELGADFSRLIVQNAPVEEAYKNPKIHWMFTGNSESMQTFAPLMRRAGAAAREMLVSAAASRWNASAAECDTANGKVRHAATGRVLRFGDVAAAAAALPLPENPIPRPDQRRLVGRALPRRDVPAKVDATATFGIDVRLPNMAFAALRLGPAPDSKVLAMDPASVLAMPGVIAVVPVPGGAAVAAATTWQAMQAARRLDIRFADAPRFDSETLAATYRAAIEGTEWRAITDRGAAPERIARAEQTFTREYGSPFQAHATMEPMNCTADVRPDGAEIWVPTQGPQQTQITAMTVLGFKPEQIKVNWTYSGGGFGRRLLGDFVVPALLASKAIRRPVQVVYDRAQDFAEDWYRPATLTRITAALDTAGRPDALHAHLVSATQIAPVVPARLPANLDPRVTEGLEDCVYQVGAFRLDYRQPDVPLRTSVLRTTGFGPNIFALESFVDELAARAGADPLAYRRSLLGDGSRARRVLDEVAGRAGWGGKLLPGHGRGVAVAHAFETTIATVVELSVDANRVVRLHRVTTVADPGQVWDPSIGAANLEGGVFWGLASALKSEIRFAGGVCTARNFDRYDVMHLWEAPVLETILLPSGAAEIGGLGEVGPVCVPPALANAVFAATGERVRALPLSRAGFSVGGRASA